MKALRPPLAASPVAYLFRFRCPRDSPTLRARCCQRSRAGGGPASSQDHCSTGDPHLPVHSHVDVSGTSQVSSRSILYLCPVPRPRPDRRSLATIGGVDAAPANQKAKAPACYQYRGYRAALAPAVYASWGMLPLPMQDSLPAGWLAFAGRGSNPLDRVERFPSSTSLPPFLDLP
jgi:hypothetical protein